MEEVTQPQLLVHSPKDNVGVVVIEGLKAHTEVNALITENDQGFTCTVVDDIPIGHKAALKDLAEGETIIKYGQDIGKLIAAVKKGEHVHSHNLKTKRW